MIQLGAVLRHTTGALRRPIAALRQPQDTVSCCRGSETVTLSCCMCHTTAPWTGAPGDFLHVYLQACRAAMRLKLLPHKQLCIRLRTFASPQHKIIHNSCLCAFQNWTYFVMRNWAALLHELFLDWSLIWSIYIPVWSKFLLFFSSCKQKFFWSQE